jgi:uncharacterized protein
VVEPMDLDVLDRFLLSDAAPDDSMGLSDLDGFLTGVLAGPELVLPSEWLPRVWGGEAPTFESEDQARLILSIVMSRYNEIARALESGEPGDLDPVFWMYEGDGTALAADWAEGFLEAIEMRPDAWLPLIEDREASALLTPILALCGDEDGGDLVPLAPGMRAKLLAEAPDLIPVCVFGVRAFWRERDSLPVRASPKPGRNAPCPCGSGRKYKRCCGAN